MTDTPIAAVVMAAGLGTRMRSAVPKHLHPLLGRRMVDWVIAAAEPLHPDPLVVVTSPASADAFAGQTVAIQGRPLGTGDAVRAARAALGDEPRDILVLSGDAVLLTAELLHDLLETHRAAGAAATVLGIEVADAAAYGRLVRGRATGCSKRIVEARDATPDELAINEINSSIYVFASAKLWPALERIQPQNAQGELYLTDTIGLLVEAGESVAIHTSPEPFEAGVNTRVELAAATAVLRDRINERHMLAGVTIVDPQTTWIEPTVEIEPDTTINPFVVAARAGPASPPARRSTRTPSSSTRRSAADALAGTNVLLPSAGHRPRARLEGGDIRGDQELSDRERTKVPHLSYIGDAEIGEGTNIAAGKAITANFPHAARPAEGPHDDRPQRQDRRPECVRGPRRDRRRLVDRRRFDHHRRRAAGFAGGLPAAPGEQGRLCKARHGSDD